MNKSGSSLNVVKISCSKFSNFVTIFAAARSMLAWHKPNDMSTPSATSLACIKWLSKIISFTTSIFPLVVNVLGQPGQASSLTSSRPSLNRLYHNRTCVLLTVDSSNTTVNISNVLAYLNSFFTQNLKQFLWTIFSNSKTRLTFLSVKNKLTILHNRKVMSTYITEKKNVKIELTLLTIFESNSFFFFLIIRGVMHDAI